METVSEGVVVGLKEGVCYYGTMTGYEVMVDNNGWVTRFKTVEGVRCPFPLPCVIVVKKQKAKVKLL